MSNYEFNCSKDVFQVTEGLQDLHLNISGEEENKNNDLVKSDTVKRVKTEHDDDNAVSTNEQEYPYDLKKLMLPMWCLLCRIRVNSATSASEHYNSKSHEHNIECWLRENLPKENSDEDMHYCGLCDLKLTSMSHAKQHYEGRKHKLAKVKLSKSSGAGSNSTGPISDDVNRFGIGRNEKPLSRSPSPPLPLLPPTSTVILSNGKPCKQIYNMIDTVVPISLEECTKIAMEEMRLQKIYDDEQAIAQSHKLYCELCDLQLSSVPDARQHYGGRRHKMVRDKLAKPSGAGHYNDEGKWVRTDSKNNSTCNDRRFGIGEAFLNKPSDSIQNAQSNSTVVSDFWCKTCNIALTSTIDLNQHCKGAKHLIKADQLNETRITDEDLNLKYRLPSGAYYCDICDINFHGLSILTSHLNGKKHVKKKQSILANSSLD